jgi:YggT family protein
LFVLDRQFWVPAQDRKIMAIFLARLIGFVANLLIILIFADSILSFILSPYHPVREVMDRIVNPLLTPIRKFVPLLGSWDISPLILIILIEIITRAMVSFF